MFLTIYRYKYILIEPRTETVLKLTCIYSHKTKIQRIVPNIYKEKKLNMNEHVWQIGNCFYLPVFYAPIHLSFKSILLILC